MTPTLTDLTIRELTPGEEPWVSVLIMREFRAHIAEDLTDEGIDLFISIVSPEALAERTGAEGSIFLTAWIGKSLVGTLVMRDGNHINLFFVDSQYHRKGIGKTLLQRAISMIKEKYNGAREIWVQSSRFAVPSYQAMGFKLQGKEIEEKGIFSIKMRKNI